MKRTPSLRALSLPVSLALMLALAVSPAYPAATKLADVPLANAATVSVLPNIYFILDDSGSMGWDYMPDYVNDTYCRGSGSNLVGCQAGDPPYYTAAFNRVYYNPMIDYTPPINADGTSKTSYTTWTNVPMDGYGKQTNATTNLVTSYVERVACKNNNDDVNGNNCKSQINAQNNYSYPDNTYSVVKDKLGGPFYYTASVEWCSATDNSPKFGKNNTCQAKKDSTYKNVRYYNWQRVNITPSVTSYPGPNGTTRTYAQEMTNFANWYAWYRTRMQMTKTAVGQAFSSIRGTPKTDIQDPTDKNFFHARIGYSTISYTGVTDGTQFLTIRNFDTTQKDSWFTKLYGAVPGGNTPLLGALAKAGAIYAGKIGAEDPIQYSCQRNFTILSTDGYWNVQSATYGPTKEDGSTLVGDQDGAATKPSYDKLGKANTLADVAYYYYHTDLRPGNCTKCKDDVPPVGTKQDEDDVAKHQHMTTFTIGLGVDGSLTYQDGYKTSTSGDYVALKQGTLWWPDPTDAEDLDRIDDLWHAAVNGRGTYFSARSPESLVNGLTSALGTMETASGSGAAAATSSLEPVAGDNAIYIANYRTVSWDGELGAYSIDLTTGAISTTTTWKASSLLDSKIAADGLSDTRTIYTSNGSALIDFALNRLSATQKAYLDNSQLSQYADWSTDQKTAGTQDNLLKYIRGQSRYEDQDRPDAFGAYKRLYRDRSTTLGDIVHAQPVYVKGPQYGFADTGYADFKTAQAARSPTVYVAANDGMLHAFNAATGAERWAYIPPMVMPNLWRLADEDYANNHRFFVDGPITVSDIKDGNSWKTILVGALGKGGRGYYALDITNPDSPTFLWTYSADDNPNMGYSYAPAAITKIDGTWAVLLPSGYNNIPEGTKYATADGVGRLFILNAANGTTLHTPISTGVGTVDSPSGLGKINPKVEFFDTDNSATRAYGGDLYGNLWRFDLINGTATKIIALGADHPITTAPEIAETSGKTVLFFGTGRYLSQDDLIDDKQQAIYGIKDDSNTPVPLDSLVQQTITNNVISSNQVDWATKGGWFINLPDQKERVTLEAKLVMGTLVFVSTVPSASECQPGGYSNMFFIDYLTGGSIEGQQSVFNFVSPIVGLSLVKLPDGTIKVIPVTADGKTPLPKSVPTNSAGTGGGDSGKRLLWRELLE